MTTQLKVLPSSIPASIATQKSAFGGRALATRFVRQRAFPRCRRLFRHTALDGDGLNVAGSFAENLVKSLQNCLNFGGISGSRDNMVHNKQLRIN
jgi:hypothetical protein